MKKFINKTAIIALPVLVILLLVNYFGDAARLFDKYYEKKMAKILASGQYITNIENYDDRLFQKELISNKNIQPNLVIIGSSRTMLINSDLFSGSSLFNNSVRGASFEDIVSIYQLYKENNKLPQKIIIGIDPWTFNENNGLKRYQSIADYYYRFQNLENQENTFYFKYKELFSFSYFQSSIKKISPFIAGKTQPQESTEKYNDTKTKLTDGSLVFGEKYRNASSKEIENKIKFYLAGGIYSIENFNVISVRIWNEFENLIADMKNNDIEIEFILVPYPPLVYDKIQKNYPMVLKTEKIIKDFALSNNIKLYGSFNPVLLGLDETFFYDGMHCKETGIKKIMRMNN